MKRSIFYSVIVAIFLVGCAPTPLPPEIAKVSSVSNSDNCKFIQNMYIETQPHTLTHYVKRNTYDTGGDSYKIISTNNQMIMGVNVMMVNFEIYKCK